MSVDRLKTAILSIIREALPSLTFFGLYEYAVVAQVGFAITGVPTSTAAGLPNLIDVPLRPNILGGQVMVLPGSLCLVAFVNGDPSRPVVVGGDPNIDPLTIGLCNGVLGVARNTDPVQAGPFAGNIMQASLRVRAG